MMQTHTHTCVSTNRHTLLRPVPSRYAYIQELESLKSPEKDDDDDDDDDGHCCCWTSDIMILLITSKSMSLVTVFLSIEFVVPNHLPYRRLSIISFSVQNAINRKQDDTTPYYLREVIKKVYHVWILQLTKNVMAFKYARRKSSRLHVYSWYAIPEQPMIEKYMHVYGMIPT